MSRPHGVIAALLAILAFVLLAAPSAHAQERILLFESDIAVARDGVLSVRETIRVVAEGTQIRHGIFRDFPTTYRDGAGNRVRVGFDVASVMRDGRDEPYVLERISNGMRVRIGEEDVLVEPGVHTYVIAYTTSRQIGFFESYDELYWNVTGNGWDFPIETASADIRLPSGAVITQYAAYTGYQGSTLRDAMAQKRSDTEMSFRTAAPLAPQQGLTVAVGFAKGIVTPPGAASRAGDFLQANASTGAALAGLLTLAAFYLYAWWRFGRDPARGTIVPLFTPPKNVSAAAVRYVRRMGYDRKVFAAALIAMAVKGYHRVSEDDGTYTLARTGKSEAEAKLSRGEAALGTALFGAGGTIELKNRNHARVSKAIGALKTALRNEDEKVYFVTNIAWFIGGLVILAISAAATAFLSDAPDESVFVLVWLSVWSAGTSFLVLRMAQAWSMVAHGPGWRIVNAARAMVMTIFAIPFVGGLIAAFAFLGSSLPIVAMGALAMQGVLALVFFHLLKAPTLAGAKIRDEIDGFKMFLETAEKDRLEILHPPHVTPDVFEAYLPYAIALDAENAWSRTFEAEAARAGEAPDRRSYTPSWYSGSSFSRLGAARFGTAIGASLATAAAAASSAPGRSSGSGGGGSSGGGGGGGGGGGW